MLFPCIAAVAAAATHSPAWFLSGAYHPPLPGKSSTDGVYVTGNKDSELGSEISGEALTVALDVIQAWAVLLTLGFTLVIFFFLAFCVCSKKDDGYDEFEINQGITTVKICHDSAENGVSFIPRINDSGTESMKATDETSEASSRYTVKRELPAIPTSAGGETKEPGKSERPISQHSSDLYASVNDPSQGSSSFKLIGGVQVLPAGAIAPGGRAAIIKECASPPESDEIDGNMKKETPFSKEVPPYAQVKKTHPYAQVSKGEHPYAKVGSYKGQETETDTDSYDDPKLIADIRKQEPDANIQQAAARSEPKKEKLLSTSPHIIDAALKTDVVGTSAPLTQSVVTTSHSSTSIHSASASTHTTQYKSPTSPLQSETAAPIPAAMAISGRTPANEEMPYMTPPVHQATREQPQHFSGDSQDSRGYTSISVREPLAALRARQSAEGAIAGLGRSVGSKMQGTDGEGYYMTVSDDSADEMYACIYEGSRGTGSETYAQIEPRTTPSSQIPPSTLSASCFSPSSPTGLSGRTPQDPSPPAPPSVDSLRHVVHSRQASASSSASAGMGSPVAEKRGTRSPLPPLPQGDIDLYSPPDPPILSSQPIPKSPPKSVAHIAEKPTPKSLEEMYAKVMKKSQGHARGSSSGAVEGGDASGNVGRRGSADIGGLRWGSASPTALKPAQDMSHSLVESRTQDTVSGVNRAKSCDVSASWGGLTADEKGKTIGVGSNYETIPSLYSGSDPGYETVRNGEPPYASVDQAENYPGYETVRSDVESEPGYETLKQKEFEPGYETVSEITSKANIPFEPGYESVTTIDYEPGYETVSNKKSSDPGYESVQEKEKAEYDPGYEELGHPTLGRTASETDPNYEQLKFPSKRSSMGESGYEVVKKDTGEANYESVSGYGTHEEPSSEAEVFEEKEKTIPIYASVKKKDSPKSEQPKETKESPENGAEKINENFNLIDTDDAARVEAPAPPSEEADSDTQGVVETVPDLDIKTSPASKENMNLVDINEAEAKSEGEKYPVMDSPEEVELPPPGGEDNHRVSPPQSPEKEIDEAETKDAAAQDSSGFEIPAKEQQPTLVSLTFTEASPPEGSPETGSTKSSESHSSSPKDLSTKVEVDTDQDISPGVKDDSSALGDIPSAPPPEFANSQGVYQDTSLTCNMDEHEPLPPPPLPSLDDDIATASPPPPPPPIPDEVCGLQQDLPLPPPEQESLALDEKEPTNKQEVNGLPASPYDPVTVPVSEDVPVCSQVPYDFPPLPCSEEEKPQRVTAGSPPSPKSGPLNGSMTVTVNPMADIEENGKPLASPPRAPPLVVESHLPPAPQVCPSGESGESQSSGSTVNGSGSVESVVTVDPKRGGDPSTTVPSDTPAGVSSSSLQHSSSTSSSDSKHSGDPNEGITPV